MNYEENIISCLHAFTFYLIYTVLYQMQNMLNSFFFHQREYCVYSSVLLLESAQLELFNKPH